MEARDPISSVRRKAPAILRPGTVDTCDIAKDVDPAASPDGERRDCAADNSSSSAAESRVWSDGLGASAVPGARCAVEMGGRARCGGVMVSWRELRIRLTFLKRQFNGDRGVTFRRPRS